MSRSICLPLTDPIVDVHSLHSFAQSIILTQGQMLNWVYANYIHLFAIPDKTADFIHFATSSRPQDIPNLFLSRLHRDQVNRWFPDIRDFVLDCLEQGYYFSTLVNEFYIPGTSAFQTYDYPHHVMFYGYDAEQDALLAAGYFSSPPKFAKERQVPLALFEKAFKTVGQDVTSMNGTVELIRFPYRDRPYGIRPELSPRHLARALEDYVHSRKTEVPAIPNFNLGIDLNQSELVFGIGIYRLLTDRLRTQTENGASLHMKTFQTLLNHKTVMLRRIRHLLDIGYIEDREAYSRYQDVWKDVRILHNLYLKNSVKFNKKNLDFMTELLKKIEINEKSELSRIGDMLIR